VNYPNFLPTVREGLSEDTSLALLENIQQIAIDSPIYPRSILTTYSQQGQGQPPFLSCTVLIVPCWNFGVYYPYSPKIGKLGR